MGKSQKFCLEKCTKAGCLSKAHPNYAKTRACRIGFGNLRITFLMKFPGLPGFDQAGNSTKTVLLSIPGTLISGTGQRSEYRNVVRDQTLICWWCAWHNWQEVVKRCFYGVPILRWAWEPLPKPSPNMPPLFGDMVRVVWLCWLYATQIFPLH